MGDQNNIVFIPLTEEDIAPLTSIMTRAFDEDARIHLGEGHRDGPPGYDNGELLMKYGILANSDAFTIWMDGQLIGSVIVFIEQDGSYYLGNICVDPAIQNKGIGTKIWGMIEAQYPEAQIWRTDTPGFSKRNHHFYIDKCGFKLIEILNPGDLDQETYRLEKRMM